MNYTHLKGSRLNIIRHKIFKKYILKHFPVILKKRKNHDFWPFLPILNQMEKVGIFAEFSWLQINLLRKYLLIVLSGITICEIIMNYNFQWGFLTEKTEWFTSMCSEAIFFNLSTTPFNFPNILRLNPTFVYHLSFLIFNNITPHLLENCRAL